MANFQTFPEQPADQWGNEYLGIGDVVPLLSGGIRLDVVAEGAPGVGESSWDRGVQTFVKVGSIVVDGGDIPALIRVLEGLQN